MTTSINNHEAGHLSNGCSAFNFIKMTIQTTQEYKAVKALEDAMNDYCWSPKRFADSIPYMHRTLQQTLVRTIVAVIQKVGAEDYRTDARNKASHELCSTILTSGVLDKSPLPLI